MRLSWLLGAFALSLTLLSLHLAGLAHFWYWKYWWFDIPMHALGGASLGAFAVALSPKRRPWGYLLLMAVLFVGWEVMEFASGITRSEPRYIFDTTHDLLDDSLGAVAMYVLARFTIWRSK